MGPHTHHTDHTLPDRESLFRVEWLEERVALYAEDLLLFLK